MGPQGGPAQGGRRDGRRRDRADAAAAPVGGVARVIDGGSTVS
ncbi:hypothetical protein [Pseudonocardia sp.]